MHPTFSTLGIFHPSLADLSTAFETICVFLLEIQDGYTARTSPRAPGLSPSSLTLSVARPWCSMSPECHLWPFPFLPEIDLQECPTQLRGADSRVTSTLNPALLPASCLMALPPEPESWESSHHFLPHILWFQVPLSLSSLHIKCVLLNKHVSAALIQNL